MNEDLRRVGHMLECAADIQRFLKGRRRALGRDEILQAALFRKFEVMGEAATHVSPAFRDAHPEIPWKRIIAFRNVLIHAYDRILMEGLLKALEELPDLEKKLKLALAGP
ncbi:MAG TPA: HepT-like ribonuclease domain-containing protein [Candidatus Thermoplasmatota archaeon]|nr:HepT-like ribonuclease domain-containing protein [Candidatus Thermoplasmatota archaeon]